MNEHIHHHHGSESMLSVELALERILSSFSELKSEPRPILKCLGRVLSERIIAPFDVPPLDNSGMDGYAVQASSVRGASITSPVILQQVGSIAAGQLPDKEVTSNTAIRIMTGAPIPKGANAVVPFEDTDESDRQGSNTTFSEIGIRAEVINSANVRPSGQDIRKNQIVLEKGCVLRPAEIGVLASVGIDKVNVVKEPKVAILATGDELIEPNASYSPGKIYDSNSYSLAAAVSHAGGIPSMLGIARDRLESISAKLHEGINSDIIITSAGVSKGDYDMMKDVLVKYGEIEFWSVRMRPGKPLAFGLLDAPEGRKVPLLGLPGNPVSSLVAFEQFGRPAIHKMLGRSCNRRPTIQAVLQDPIYNTDGRRVYARTIVTKRGNTYYASLAGNQSSNLLTSLTRANGLAICPENVPEKVPGEIVTVQMLDWPEFVF